MSQSQMFELDGAGDVVDDDLNGFRINVPFRNMKTKKRSKRHKVTTDPKTQKKNKIRRRRQSSHRY